jgi:hypothetical protein
MKTQGPQGNQHHKATSTTQHSYTSLAPGFDIKAKAASEAGPKGPRSGPQRGLLG